MVSIHYNNHITSQQTVGENIVKAILSGHDEITLSVDDGDGDVWKYEIMVITKYRVDTVTQIKEN